MDCLPGSPNLLGSPAGSSPADSVAATAAAMRDKSQFINQNDNK